MTNNQSIEQATIAAHLAEIAALKAELAQLKAERPPTRPGLIAEAEWLRVEEAFAAYRLAVDAAIRSGQRPPTPLHPLYMSAEEG